MNRADAQQHLSQISTMWTVLRQAHQGGGSEALGLTDGIAEPTGGSANASFSPTALGQG